VKKTLYIFDLSLNQSECVRGTKAGHDYLRVLKNDAGQDWKEFATATICPEAGVRTALWFQYQQRRAKSVGLL